MCEIDFKLKAENENNKELFNFNGAETQIKRIKEIFTNSIQNSKNNCAINFIHFLNFYSLCRPHQQRVSKELVECVYSCFPEQIKVIQKSINTCILKFIMFPEEFPINESKEQQEMFLLLEKDDIDEFISFLSKNPTIDITQEQQVENLYYYHLLNRRNPIISLIDFCCFFGSLKCFKYLLLNKCEITENTPKWSIAGGNQEIINILKEKGYSFEECLETSVKYHRYELTNWLIENYKCKPFPLPYCIEYYNIDSFLYFLEHGHSIDETNENGGTCLHSASIMGSFPILQYLIEKGANIEVISEAGTPLHIACFDGNLQTVQYLIEKGADIEAKDWEEKTPLHCACSYGHLPIVQYLIEKGANIEAKDDYQCTPLHFACSYGHLPIVQYLIEKGANIEAKGQWDKQTPLHKACENNQLEVAQYLIEKGANIEANSYFGTPLHIASKYGRTDIVQYLVSKGANKNAKTLMTAPNDEIIELLQ